MSNRTKKAEEYLSLKSFINHCPSPFVRQLKDAEDVSSEKQERPDIVLRNGDSVYGIEHINIPLLMIEDGSSVKIEAAHTAKTFNKYRLDDGVDRLSGKEELALKEIEKIVNDRESSVSSFSHKNYIENFSRLLEKHDANLYLKNTAELYPESNTTICFLLDIAYPNEFSKGMEYKKRSDNRWCAFVRKDYPFTYAFLNLLERKQGVAEFLLIWHPIDDYSDKNTRSYVLHGDSNMIKQVPTAVWEEFRLPLIHRVSKRVNLILEGKNDE